MTYDAPAYTYTDVDALIERNFRLEAVARAAKQVDRLCGWPANPDPGFAEAKALGTLRKALKALEEEA